MLVCNKTECLRRLSWRLLPNDPEPILPGQMAKVGLTMWGSHKSILLCREFFRSSGSRASQRNRRCIGPIIQLVQFPFERFTHQIHDVQLNILQYALSNYRKAIVKPVYLLNKQVPQSLWIKSFPFGFSVRFKGLSARHRNVNWMQIWFLK